MWFICLNSAAVFSSDNTADDDDCDDDDCEVERVDDDENFRFLAGEFLVWECFWECFLEGFGGKCEYSKERRYSSVIKTLK